MSHSNRLVLFFLLLTTTDFEANASEPDRPQVTCMDVSPVRAVIGRPARYDVTRGLRKSNERGFAVRVADAAPVSGCHYEIRSGECLVLQYRSADVGQDLQRSGGAWDDQYVVLPEQRSVDDVGGARIVNPRGPRPGALIGRCPVDQGFGCSPESLSDRSGAYFSQVNEAGLQHTAVCAHDVRNQGHAALGKAVFGGKINEARGGFLFTVGWTVERAR